MNHNQLNPFSSDPKGKNPFTVPEGYFEGLQGKIMKRIDSQDNKSPRLVHLPKSFTGYAAAAVLVIVMTVAGILILRDRTSTENRAYENIAMDLFMNNGLDEALITEYIIGNTAPVLAQDIIIAESLVQSATNKEFTDAQELSSDNQALIEDYLLETGITESELLQNL